MNIQGPCVIALDAPWGDGKTAFVKMWVQYLRGEECKVTEVNAKAAALPQKQPLRSPKTTLTRRYQSTRTSTRLPQRSHHALANPTGLLSNLDSDRKREEPTKFVHAKIRSSSMLPPLLSGIWPS